MTPRGPQPNAKPRHLFYPLNQVSETFYLGKKTVSFVDESEQTRSMDCYCFDVLLWRVLRSSIEDRKPIRNIGKCKSRIFICEKGLYLITDAYSCGGILECNCRCRSTDAKYLKFTKFDDGSKFWEFVECSRYKDKFDGHFLFSELESKIKEEFDSSCPVPDEFMDQILLFKEFLEVTPLMDPESEPNSAQANLIKALTGATLTSIRRINNFHIIRLVYEAKSSEKWKIAKVNAQWLTVTYPGNGEVKNMMLMSDYPIFDYYTEDAGINDRKFALWEYEPERYSNAFGINYPDFYSEIVSSGYSFAKTTLITIEPEKVSFFVDETGEIIEIPLEKVPMADELGALVNLGENVVVDLVHFDTEYRVFKFESSSAN